MQELLMSGVFVQVRVEGWRAHLKSRNTEGMKAFSMKLFRKLYRDSLDSFLSAAPNQAPESASLSKALKVARILVANCSVRSASRPCCKASVHPLKVNIIGGEQQVYEDKEDMRGQGLSLLDDGLAWHHVTA